MNELILFYRTSFTVELLVLELLLFFPMERRERFPLRLVLGLPLFIAFGVFCPIPVTGAVGGSSMIFGVSILLMWSIFRMTGYETVFLCVSAYLLQNTVLNVGKVLRILLRTPLGHLILTDLLALVLVGTLAWFLLLRKRQLHTLLEEGTAGDHLIILTSVTSISIIVTMNTLFGENGLDYDLFCRIALIFSNLFALSLQYSELRRGSLEVEKQIVQQLMEAERQQYQISRETIDIINVKCHDLKHQISAIRSASSSEQDQVLAEVENAALIYNALAKTGCDTLDAVLTEKLLFCEKYHILLSYMVDPKGLERLQDADLYILFGNALDNAIEHELKEPEDRRMIDLRVEQKCGMLTIHLENCCTTPPTFQNGLPLTTKYDKANHGFGVKSLRYLAEKYHGYTTFQARDGMFVLDIAIPGNG